MFDFLIRCCRAQQQCKPSTDPQANQQRACGTMAVCVVVKRRTGGVAGPRQSLLPLATAVGLWWSRVRRGKYSSSGGKLFAYMSVQIADFCKGNLQLLKQQRQQCVIALIATLTLTAHTSIHPQSGGWCLWLRVQRRSCVCSLSWAQIAEFCNSAVGQQQPGVTAANPRSRLHDHTREHRVGCECCLSEVVVCIVGEYG